jgi:hypothetical protein
MYLLHSFYSSSRGPTNGSASRIAPAKRLRAAGVARSSLFLTFRPPGLFATQVTAALCGEKLRSGSGDLAQLATAANSNATAAKASG